MLVVLLGAASADAYLGLAAMRAGRSPVPYRTRALCTRGAAKVTMEANAGSGPRLGLQQLLDFERKGHIKLQDMLPSPEDADRMHLAVSREYMRRRKEAYVQKVRLFAAEDEDDDLYQQALQCKSESEARGLLEAWCNENEVPVPFLQVFNVHRDSTEDARTIHAFATSTRMGHTAAALLGVPSVRLYQTSVFMKERGHGETSWHADLATSPFDSNHMITCWIALTPIETEVGPERASTRGQECT